MLGGTGEVGEEVRLGCNTANNKNKDFMVYIERKMSISPPKKRSRERTHENEVPVSAVLPVPKASS
jgi:hypothetical protein